MKKKRDMTPKQRRMEMVRAANNQAARLVYLEEHGTFCDICKQTTPIEELNIRLKGAKKRSAGQVLGMANEAKKKKYMEGAIVVCGSCHHSTTVEGTERSAHGVRRYNFGCRCATCRMAMRLFISIENGGTIPGKTRRKPLEKEVKAYGQGFEEAVLESENGVNTPTGWEVPGLLKSPEPARASD